MLYAVLNHIAMKYEVHLIDEVTKQLIHHYESVFVPMSGDVIPVDEPNNVCFVVNKRLLPDSDSNRMVCIGRKDAATNAI